MICAHDSVSMHGRFGRALARFVRSSRFIILRNALLKCYLFLSKRYSTVFFLYIMLTRSSELRPSEAPIIKKKVALQAFYLVDIYIDLD